MVQVAGTYQLVKNENFVEYFVGLGVPEELVKKGDALKPKLTIVIDGKKLSLNSDSGVPNSSVTLTLGEEVDEPTPYNITLKSTAKLDGDTLTINSTTPGGKSGTRVYKFTDTELVITFTSNDSSVPTAKRYYKRV